MNRPGRVAAPAHLAGYTAAPPFAWSGWRLRIPGGPEGGQYHGFIAADSAGWPNGYDEMGGSGSGLGDVDVTTEPWESLWGGTALREGQDLSDHVFRSSAEMRPRPNASGGANVIPGYQRRRSAGFAEAPGNYRALGAVIPIRGGSVVRAVPTINPNVVYNPSTPRSVMTTASGEDVPLGSVAAPPGGSTFAPVAIVARPYFGPALAPAYGATATVAQPPAPSGSAPPQYIVGSSYPPVSPQPSPTVAAGPANFVPSVGQPLPPVAGAPWQPGTAYALGATVTDANGNVQTAVAAGTSAGAAPSWGTVLGNTTSDNTVVWQMTAAGAGAASSLTSWFSQSTVIAGVENLWIALGAGALLFMMMRGKK